jgi:hypothetical protein
VTYYRPGPESIEAGRCPGGLVVQCWPCDPDAVEPIVESTVGPTDDVETLAVSAADAVNERPGDVCLVVYDGDTGERWSATSIALAALGVTPTQAGLDAAFDPPPRRRPSDE